jgi:ABC-type cobalt transport system substrate-binding protein
LKPEVNLSIRKLIISVVVAAVVIVASVITTSYARSGYFVAYEDETPAARILIYQGKEFLWFNPTIEADSTLIRSDLNLVLDAEIVAGQNFSSPTDVQKYVNQIREVVGGN